MSLDTNIALLKEIDSNECNKLFQIPIEATHGTVEINLIWFSRFYSLHNIIKEKEYYDPNTQEAYMVIEDLFELEEEIKNDSDIYNVKKFLSFIERIKNHREFFVDYIFIYFLG